MRLSDSNLELIRNPNQSTELHLSIFSPVAIFKAQVNNISAAAGDRVITFDSVSFGLYTYLKDGMSMWVGLTPGGMELGKIRIRSATSTQITVSENNTVDWRDNAYLTVFNYWELFPIYPRIIKDPANPNNVVFYKDFDISYFNQNSVLGTFVNAGPHRAAILDPASNQAQLYYSATGSYNLLGDSLTYDWFFEGAMITGSTLATPGYIPYNTPGHYVTRLSISGSSGSGDTTYRYVSIYDNAHPPVQKWELSGPQGSRDEGGYTASIKVFEPIAIQENAVVVIFGKSWFGNTQINLGGNAPNSGDIFFVGYIDKDTIEYDYEHSEVSFDAVSLTETMKKTSGFSVSVKSVANPTKWFELLDMDGKRALYHYLKWHTTALSITDFQFIGTDPKVQYFDSDRGSMYDAIDNYMQNTLIGHTVSDRQGKIWMEVDAMAYQNPTGTFSPPIMDITNRDWMGTPNVEERLIPEVSYLEYGGVAFSGVVTGTFNPFIGSAPGNAPGFYGAIDNHEGMALEGQEQLNQLMGNIFANKNSPYPTINTDLSFTAANIDIAPQESLGLHIAKDDTVRNQKIDGLYIPDSMEWKYNPQDQRLLAQLTANQLLTGKTGQTVTIPNISDIGGGFVVPRLELPPLPLDFPPTTNESGSGDGSPSRVLIHDTVAGLIYTTTFNNENAGVGWFQGNGGLTMTQYQGVQKAIVCPNGAIYVANLGRADHTKTFLARAPSLGAPFTVLLDSAAVNALVGDPNGIVAQIACNPAAAEDVFVLLGHNGSNAFVYRGGGGGPFTSDFAFRLFFDFNFGSSDCDISFGAGQWLLTNGGYAVLNYAGSSVIRGGTIATQCTRHTRGGILGGTIHWPENSTGNSLAVGVNNDTSVTINVGNSNIFGNMFLLEDGLVCDPTGVFMMTSNAFLSPIKSSDGGYSWSQMTFLAPLVFHYFANCGDSQRWIAVAGSGTPEYSPNFGSSWITKSGNLNQIVALPNLDIVKIIP